MKVVGYTRVSTEEQATSGVSLAAQAEKIRSYASCYDLEITEIIEDAGHSAKSLERPGIQRALEMIRDGQVQGILVAKLDRLTRSIVDLNMLLADYFTEKAHYGASLFSVNDQIDTGSASGRLVLNVLMSVLQWERETIGERTKTALQFKKAQGVKLGRPEGWKKQITNPEELRTINYAKELKAQGLTFRAIATRLEDEGYKTLRGGKWAPQTIKNLLEMKEVA